jgi:hypothetical protein
MMLIPFAGKRDTTKKVANRLEVRRRRLAGLANVKFTLREVGRLWFTKEFVSI